MSPGLPGVISSTEKEKTVWSLEVVQRQHLLLSLLIVTYQLPFFLIKLSIVLCNEKNHDTVIRSVSCLLSLICHYKLLTRLPRLTFSQQSNQGRKTEMFCVIVIAGNHYVYA